MRGNAYNPIDKGLQSPSWHCRKWGCVDHVPSEGCYPGLPQAYCYYCHTRVKGAAKGCPDVCIHDESDIYKPTVFERFMTWLEKKGIVLVKDMKRYD